MLVKIVFVSGEVDRLQNKSLWETLQEVIVNEWPSFAVNRDVHSVHFISMRKVTDPV